MILLISGSLRKGSTNTALLRTLRQIAPSSINAVLYDDLSSLPHFDPDLDHDPLPPAVNRLRTAVRVAGALLFSTPEYAGALPGSFKNLLDWTIGDEDPRSIYRKPVAWINVSSSSTGPSTRTSLWARFSRTRTPTWSRVRAYGYPSRDKRSTAMA
jgi:NAD(P)H-dependent FMN reductase